MRSHPSARVLAITYALVRVPVTVLDRSVVQRLPVRSRTRTVFDHGLGTADHWVGLIVADDTIVTSGRARIEQAGRFSGDRTAIAPAYPSSVKGYARTRSAASRS